MCHHQPQCPELSASDREAARIVASCHAQGWVRLCNGIVLFDDTGGLLPNGGVVLPRRSAASKPVLKLDQGA
ncbi:MULTISPECIES: DUF5999 family protein [Streptomyces]|uniref:DUF5999 family protein n=1 Tax=Streptomyces TaxID=1883 RepID=UPI00099C0DE7|nr:DUF5999 family protein [Streptomyces virginiae]